MDRFQNSRIRATAADMPFQPVQDLSAGRLGLVSQERGGAQNHPRGAIAALKGIFGQEGFLNRMQLRAFAEPFDRRDRLAVHLAHRSQARKCAFAVDQDRAGATAALPTAIFRSGKLEIFAKNFQQGALSVSGDGSWRAIDSQVDSGFHTKSSVHLLGGLSSVRILALK